MRGRERERRTRSTRSRVRARKRERQRVKLNMIGDEVSIEWVEWRTMDEKEGPNSTHTHNTYTH